MMARVIVAGAGLSGLALAYHLKWRQTELPSGLDLKVLEGSARTGGVLRSEQLAGCLVERGPEHLPGNSPWSLALAQRLGLPTLRGEAAACDGKLLWRGALHDVPDDPGALRAMGAASPMDLLKVGFADPPPTGVDETVGGFFRRHLGPIAGQLVASALCADRFAADPDTLSMAACFPQVQAEALQAGNLLRVNFFDSLQPRVATLADDKRGSRLLDEVLGLMAANTAEAGMRRFQGGALALGQGLVSFKGGMQRLTDALSEVLADKVQLNAQVLKIEGNAPGRSSGPYRVSTQTAAGVQVDEVDGLCLSLSAEHAAPLLAALDPELAAALAAIPFTDLTEVTLSWPANAAPSLSGRGYVNAGDRQTHHLKASWTHKLFPTEAGDTVRVRVSFGGPGYPSVHDLPDDRLIELTTRELQPLLGGPSPIAAEVRRRAQRVPLYTPGHKARLATVERRLTQHPGLTLTGSSYYGVGISEVLRHVGSVGDALITSLRHGEGRRGDVTGARRG